MHPEILTKKQAELLPLLKNLSEEYGLVGGTAIALHLGHRESLDFDLFKNGSLDILQIKRNINKLFPIDQVRVENSNEYTLRVNNIQFTFYNYPFNIAYDIPFQNVIALPNLLTLAAMKAYALGKRAKWKDYVDLYFILQKHSLHEVVTQSETIFKGEFSEKLFREQLSYYEDIDYSEQIDYLQGFEKKDAEIKTFLENLSLT